MNSKTLTISINHPARKVYEFVRNPQNLPRWGKTFVHSVKKSGLKWIIQTQQGPMTIRFAKKNSFGVLDHYLRPQPKVEIFVPLRVVPNGKGSEVIFTIFQYPGMTNSNFKKDIGLVKKDLRNLKSALEYA